MCDDCERLYEELEYQAHEMYLLRSANTKLEQHIKRVQHEKKKLVKEKKKDMKLRYKKRSRNGKHKDFYGYL